MRCWGEINWGNSGYEGLPEPFFEPGSIASGHNTITGGSGFLCAVLRNSTVACWGNNHLGRLGAPSDVYYSTVPMLVKGLTNVASIAAGRDHACAVLRDGTAQCWGSDQDYKLGSGEPYSQQRFPGSFNATPQVVFGLTSVQVIAPGSDALLCFAAGRPGLLLGAKLWELWRQRSVWFMVLSACQGSFALEGAGDQLWRPTHLRTSGKPYRRMLGW